MRDISSVHDQAGDNPEAPEEVCDECGRPMALKDGRLGRFLSCTGYPRCKATRKIQSESSTAKAAPKEPCPRCGENLVLKHGRFGHFTACSKYPKCRYIKQETTGVSCPRCGTGELVVKNSKRGSFYGCSNYPGCKFTIGDKPIPKECPECGARYLVEISKPERRELQCRAEGCDYRQLV